MRYSLFDRTLSLCHRLSKHSPEVVRVRSSFRTPTRRYPCGLRRRFLASIKRDQIASGLRKVILTSLFTRQQKCILLYFSTSLHITLKTNIKNKIYNTLNNQNKNQNIKSTETISFGTRLLNIPPRTPIHYKQTEYLIYLSRRRRFPFGSNLLT